MANDQPNGSRLDAELERAKAADVDVPPDFTASVMRRVRTSAEGLSMVTRWRRRFTAFRYSAQVSTGGNTVMKKVLIGTVAAAAIVLGVAYWTGYPPILNEGTEATVGVAQRYQGKQMSDKDVVLGDAAAQTFLQSETFDRIAKDPSARAALKKIAKDPALQATLLNPELLALLRREHSAELFARASVADLLRHADLLAAMQDAEFAAAISEPAVLARIAQPEVQAALSARDARVALTAPDILARFADLQPQYRALLRHLNAELAASLRNVELVNALRTPEMTAALNNAELRQLFTNADLIAALRRPDMAVAFADPQLISALRQVDFVNALAANGFEAALKSQAFEAALLQR
jgi:hypothetical protein